MPVTAGGSTPAGGPTPPTMSRSWARRASTSTSSSSRPATERDEGDRSPPASIKGTTPPLRPMCPRHPSPVPLGDPGESRHPCPAPIRPWSAAEPPTGPAAVLLQPPASSHRLPSKALGPSAGIAARDAASAGHGGACPRRAAHRSIAATPLDSPFSTTGQSPSAASPAAPGSSSPSGSWQPDRVCSPARARASCARERSA